MKWRCDVHAYVLGMCGKLVTSISEVADLIRVSYAGFCDVTLGVGEF